MDTSAPPPPPLLDYSIEGGTSLRDRLPRIASYLLVALLGAVVGAVIASQFAPDPSYTAEAYYDLTSVSRSAQSTLLDEESVAAALTSLDFRDQICDAIRKTTPPALANSLAARDFAGPRLRSTLSVNFLHRKGLIHVHAMSPNSDEAVRFAQTSLAAVHDRLANDHFDTNLESSSVFPVVKNDDSEKIVVVAGSLAGAATLPIGLWTLRSYQDRR
jgi:hypothetical protein